MKFGLTPTNSGMGVSPSGARHMAVLAEELGFESLWTVEHVVVPSGYVSEYPYDESGKMAGGLEVFDLADPLIWLAYVAAVTERIKLATGVLILPQRNPLITAKAVATLDVLSGGRVLLGVGVGWLEEEFKALGVSFHDRGVRLDNSIEAMRTLWADEKASEHNHHVSYDNCISRPAPVNGTVPIVIGGHTPPAIRRAGRLGDGFFPVGNNVDDVGPAIELMRRSAEAAGRDPDSIEITAGAFIPDADELFRRVEAFQQLGVARVVIAVRREEKLRTLAAQLTDRFGMTA
jgi:probable F420-dependent oxidoreductase